MLLDDIDDQIKDYGLYLRGMGAKVFQLTVEDDKVSFLTKYPVPGGFLDDYPE